jgi:hypothetical protein
MLKSFLHHAFHIAIHFHRWFLIQNYVPHIFSHLDGVQLQISRYIS